MKKIALILTLILMILVGSGCGRFSSHPHSSTSAISTSSESSSKQQTEDDASLDAQKLTVEQLAALTLYYGDAHMPGADNYDYSANMEKDNQGAVVKIYDKGAVPHGEGPATDDYPRGAKELYTIKLTTGDDEDGHRLNSIYYTVVDDKVYFANSSDGIRQKGVSPSDMVTYAKTHGEVNRVLNVAKGTKIIDMRGKVNVTDKDGLTTQQLGTMVAMLKVPAWLENNNQVYYGNQYGYGTVAGYQYITTGNDLASYVWFKRDGNNVTIKTVDPSKNQSVTGEMTTTHTTISTLMNNYYVTQEQKSEVNTYADQMKNVDSPTQN